MKINLDKIVIIISVKFINIYLVILELKLSC